MSTIIIIFVYVYMLLVIVNRSMISKILFISPCFKTYNMLTKIRKTSFVMSSIDAAADYPKILDADWSIQILDQSASRIAYLGQAMLDNPLIC